MPTTSRCCHQSGRPRKVVPAGGVVLLMAAKAITVKGDNEDLDASINIVRKAPIANPPDRGECRR